MAGDSRITVDGMVITDKATKVRRLRSGYLFGWCGKVEDAEQLLRALNKNEPPPPGLEVTAILVSPDREIKLFEGSIWITQREPYYSLGSGAPYAIGAMDAGADATTAARIGSQRDSMSGGKIKKVTFRDE